MNVTTQRWSLRLVGAAGAAIFLAFLSLTWAVPDWVETFAAEYIESEVEERIDRTIDSLQPPQSDNAIARFAQSVYAQNEERIEQLRTNLRSEVHEQWADAIAAVRNLDCECRDRYADFFERGLQTDITLLQAANDRIVGFIQGGYMEVATELKRDIRIFTASNAAVFILLLLVSFLKPQAVTHLFLPGTLMAASTLICSYFYIFEQNWLLTIIHNDYLGFAYLGWLGVVFLFLCDIVFNRGRVTTEILNAILNTIGSAATVLPC